MIASQVRIPQPLYSAHPLPLPPDFSEAASFDLSTATTLKDLTFVCSRPNVQWITMALQTVRSTNLRQITIGPYPSAPPVTTEEAVYEEWKDLDQLLVQFISSRSIRPMIAYVTEEGGMFLRLNVQDLLPELTKRGSVDLVEYNP